MGGDMTDFNKFQEPNGGKILLPIIAGVAGALGTLGALGCYYLEQSFSESSKEGLSDATKPENIVFVDKVVEVEKPFYIEKIVTVEKPVYVDKIIQVEKAVPVPCQAPPLVTPIEHHESIMDIF